MNPAKRLVQFAFVGVVISTLFSGQLCIAKADGAPSKDAGFYLKRGFERSMQGDNRGAEADYRTASNLEPKNSTAVFNHANALCRLGEFRRGVNEYNRAIKICERNGLAFVGRGCAKAKLGDAYSAIEDFDQAIRLDQHNWIAYFDRSVVKAKLPENRDFYQDYEKALELESNYAPNFFNLPETNLMKKNRPMYNTTNPSPLSFSPTSLKPSEFEKVRQIAEDPKLFSTKYDAFRRFPELYVPDSTPISISPLEVEMVPRELQILANSNVFADGVSGLMLPIGSKHELFVAFQCTISCGVKIPSSVLKEYFDLATPAGKLYIAILMRKFDPKLGIDELRVLANDETKIGYRDGCMILEFTVGQLAQLLAREESFKRFMASNMILTMDEYTDYMRKIVSTEMVQDLSLSKKLEVLPSFQGIGGRLVGPQIGPVPSATLKKLFITATPAGKLYIAAIMQKIDPKVGTSALTELSKEFTKVIYVSGAKSEEYSVAEIATELLRTGAFQDFDIRKNLSSK